MSGFQHEDGMSSIPPQCDSAVTADALKERNAVNSNSVEQQSPKQWNPFANIATLPISVCHGVSWFILMIHLIATYWQLAYYNAHGTLHMILMGVNVVYLIAFWSLMQQVDGLLGPRVGLLPIDKHLPHLQKICSIQASFPIKWILSWVWRVAKYMCKHRQTIHLSHMALLGILISLFNIGVSVLVENGLTRYFWQTVAFTLLYALYLCFRFIGREFLAFQWDVLLLEVGLLASFIPPALFLQSKFCLTLCISMLRLLMFKVLFCSGINKLSTPHSLWPELRALHYHYWTQPLPSPLSWTAYWSNNKSFHSLFVLVVEVVFSFCCFGIPKWRLIGFLVIFVFIVGLITTGNVSFLPHLMFVLLLSLFDDDMLYLQPPVISTEVFLHKLLQYLASCFLSTVTLSLFIVYTLANMHYFFKVWQRPGVQAPSFCIYLCKELAAISACNSFGLFSVVTTRRYEIVIKECHINREGLEEWSEIEIRYKPSDIQKVPSWLWTGHFPRLDWRLWFVPLRLRGAMSAAIRGSQIDEAPTTLYPPFWQPLLEQICKRQPETLELLGPQAKYLLSKPPPKSLKIALYDYRLVPPDGIPLYAAFFPEGWSSLSQRDIQHLKEELTQWEIGKWWMRRHHQTIDLLNFCPGKVHHDQ